MNGFFVTISNDLLEDKHFEKMSNAVWLYMWLIDKMTEISEGIGIVSYGNPVSLNDVRYNFPTLNERTYQRMVKTLKDGGYINTSKAKYGIYITVNKPKKIFGGKTRPDKSVVTHSKTAKTRQKRRQDPTNLSPRPDKNVGSLYIDNNTNNNTVTYNSTNVELGDQKSPTKNEHHENVAKLYYEAIKSLDIPVRNHNNLRSAITKMAGSTDRTGTINYLKFMRDQFNATDWPYKPHVTEALDIHDRRAKIRQTLKDATTVKPTAKGRGFRGNNR